MTRTTAKPVARRPSAKFRLRILAADEVAIGPGKVDLLEAIRDQGSLSQAARTLGISYRRAWNMLDELNAKLKQPAVHTETGGSQGGGTQLTAVGEDILTRYRRIEQQAAQACKDDLKALMARVKR